ncbi:hypothetical protein HC175_06850 [Salinimicrobium sp. CDJ15-91]|uniref:DUF4440 domain-containing protein n=1 Tax=Salinimicrobium oceani TaxID=2722702 RepID=A0ABX1CXH4_9FLAO|nr:hypothetical protein [Salinimicrobium oceani]
MTLLFATLVSCKNDDRKMEDHTSALDSLSTELALQQEINDSLQYLMEKSEMAAAYPIYFGRDFDSIANPEQYISEALKQQKQIIPMEAVLGGQMEFRQVQVLTEDWVLAIYDDGHVQGKTIFEYELQKDGKLRFQEVASKLPNGK